MLLSLSLLMSVAEQAAIPADQPPQLSLAIQNQRHIERIEDRIHTIERQLDKIERAVEGIGTQVSDIDNDGNTELLLYILMVMLGVDKGSYWVQRRRNGGGKKE